MTYAALRISAPAKVNLHLAVGPLGADGYHPVETVMHTLALADEVTIRPAADLTFTCTPDLDLPSGSNLAYRAAQAMAQRFGRELGVAISVEKRIPTGAGLGGASADAAAVIVGLAELWGIDHGQPALREVARALGVDAPFFLTGGAARLTGRGDILAYPLPPLDAPVTVVRPVDPVPTAAAYRAFDALPRAAASDPDVLEAALRTGDTRAVAGALYNAMTPSSLGLVPAIGDALAVVRSAAGVLGVEMSGSGSAVFGIFTDPHDALLCASAANGAGFWASATRFSPSGCVAKPL
ncbi:MAG: 4-(cytidine 5'-diphospho)-2-C-methyl-D-erythritol kinase [Coriobacteriia bacterium]|nr:4-(cytidine 5'-diphospho)-2-C-methyl-D-erythritol kinase [Coriobacteriia bacterium]